MNNNTVKENLPVKLSQDKITMLLGHLGVQFVNKSWGLTTTKKIDLATLVKAFQLIVDNPTAFAEEQKK